MHITFKSLIIDNNLNTYPFMIFKYFYVHSKFVLLSEHVHLKKSRIKANEKVNTNGSIEKSVQRQIIKTTWANREQSEQDLYMCLHRIPLPETREKLQCSAAISCALQPGLHSIKEIWLSSSLQRVSSPLLMPLLLASLWTSLSSFLFQVVQGYFHPNLVCMQCINTHIERKWK